MEKVWIKVAVLTEVPDGGTHRVAFDGEPVCLYRIGSDVCATQDTCSHAQASLSEGYLENGLIECPLHQATFDIRTGKAMSAPATADLRVYPVRLDGDAILLSAPAD